MRNHHTVGVLITCLSSLKHNDWPPWLVVACIKEIPKIEEPRAVRLVNRVVVEMVDGNGEVVGWVKE